MYVIHTCAVYVETFAGILFHEVVKKLASQNFHGFNFHEYIACLILRLVTANFSFSRIQTNSKNTWKGINHKISTYAVQMASPRKRPPPTFDPWIPSTQGYTLGTTQYVVCLVLEFSTGCPPPTFGPWIPSTHWCTLETTQDVVCLVLEFSTGRPPPTFGPWIPSTHWCTLGTTQYVVCLLLEFSTGSSACSAMWVPCTYTVACIDVTLRPFLP